MASDQAYLTIPEAAVALDVSESSVRRWARSGRITVNRLPSGRVRIPAEVIAEILRPDQGNAA